MSHSNKLNQIIINKDKRDYKEKENNNFNNERVRTVKRII